MDMATLKQVKVDNWGIYFLQRLKHFFNRTDYCDLTLQFQDNAQLKVHRLVLSACTEYFEILERTCEMYEDCLVMPDDLQADVVVPIINFMYTGQLEFKVDLLEKLFQTSLIMNMPVLTKLLQTHRNLNVVDETPKKPPVQSYSKKQVKASDLVKRPCKYATSQSKAMASSSHVSNKRSFSRAFEGDSGIRSSTPSVKISQKYEQDSFADTDFSISRKVTLGEPKPTRYELPEDLDTDNIFDHSFANISYTSKPLMVHPDSTKHYSPKKKSKIFNEPSSSRSYTGTGEVVECKKVIRNDNIFEDTTADMDESDIFQPSFLNSTIETQKDSSQLFDQILDSNEGPKVTIETKDKQTASLDHAKIISEVLKKYPHLMKSNKNIKLKILDTPPAKTKKREQYIPPTENKIVLKSEKPDFTYETEVLDSKEAARLIALGAENINGPWICLICGTPGRAIHFPTYYKFRRHLIEVHNEKPVSNLCEYCGLKSFKRNYMLHHLYTKHGVPPPPQFNFPKCNICNYVALTEAYLVKHKLGHSEHGRSFRCNVCAATYNTSAKLLVHIQTTGHKYSAERRANLQCIYCQKVFLRESNLYAHIKINHKLEAKSDGIIEDSDDEQDDKTIRNEFKSNVIKLEPVPNYEKDDSDSEIQYQIQQKPDGNIKFVTRKSIQHQRILNSNYNSPTHKRSTQKLKTNQNIPIKQTRRVEYVSEASLTPQHEQEIEDVVEIDGNEYIIKENQLIPKQKLNNRNIIPTILQAETDENLDTVETVSSMDFATIQSTSNEFSNLQTSKMVLKKPNINQPIQIVVSNEEEYKALMSTNHSIIFDDSDPNKTLTVLTAPHDSTLGTTIDLDNTQSNDMMIIQEHYPLNVTQSENDSSIMVVYSEDQNKQYQLITSQDISPQFVQSSVQSVLTQNYETVTTTPVMSAHVIDTQIEVPSWQNNVQEVQMDQEIAGIATTQSEVISIDTSNSSELNNLPVVQIITQDQNISEAQSIATEEHFSQQTSNAELSSNVEGMGVDEHNEQISEPVVEKSPAHQQDGNEDVSEGELPEIPQTAIVTTEQPSQHYNPEQFIDVAIIPEQGIEVTAIPQEVANAPVQNMESNVLPQESESTVHHTQDTTAVLQQESEIILEQNQNGSNQEKESHELNESEQESLATAEVINPVETTLETSDKEVIQTLTSEWSEDEYETQTQEDLNNVNHIRNNLVSQTSANVEQPEVEETIENIRQEIQNQVNNMPEADLETEGSLNSSQEDLTNIQESQTNRHDVEPIVVEAAQEKISSLLNDWDENDSQEGGSSINESEVELPTENIPEKKQDSDSIKKLVSDWDDDEEEKETQID